MILRIWHGYSTPGNADTYEALLKRFGARSQHYELRESRSY